MIEFAPHLAKAMQTIDGRKKAAFGDAVECDGADLLRMLLPMIVGWTAATGGDAFTLARASWLDGFLLGLFTARFQERAVVEESRRLAVAEPVQLRNAGRGRWGRS